jgi:hypothetical protein
VRVLPFHHVRDGGLASVRVVFEVSAAIAMRSARYGSVRTWETSSWVDRKVIKPSEDVSNGSRIRPGALT